MMRSARVKEGHHAAGFVIAESELKFDLIAQRECLIV